MPPIKACEWDPSQGGGAYIYFHEYIDIPGLKKADISIRFDRGNSYEEIQALVKYGIHIGGPEMKTTEPNQALEPTIFAVTSRTPSSTLRASCGRGSS
jgi:hypothetical protein